MEIKTKFDFGKRVWPISYHLKTITTKCEFCEGKGYFIFKAESCQCPKCFDGYHRTSMPEQYNVGDSFVVGRIASEHHNPKNKEFKDARNWVYYMAQTSGTMFDEKNLFGSEKEAQDECDKLNAEIPK